MLCYQAGCLGWVQSLTYVIVMDKGKLTAQLTWLIYIPQRFLISCEPNCGRKNCVNQPCISTKHHSNKNNIKLVYSSLTN